MSLGTLALVVASGVQGGDAKAPGYETAVIVAVIAVLLAASTAIGFYLRRRARRPKPVADHWQALTVMGELCPHGWQAQITLYGWGAPVPDDAPPSRVPLIELEWMQFEEESGHIAVARRVWAPTIAGALQTMVEDRKTDITLEEIEAAADGDDEMWWND
jgi:hypothetical protein